MQLLSVCNDTQLASTEAHSAAAWHWPKPRYSTSGKELGELLLYGVVSVSDSTDLG